MLLYTLSFNRTQSHTPPHLISHAISLALALSRLCDRNQMASASSDAAIASLLAEVKKESGDGSEVPLQLTGMSQPDPNDPNASLFEVAGGLNALESLPPELLAALAQAERDELGKTQRDDGGVDIQPEASFVVKTSDETGRKVFVNVCGHAYVPLPGHWMGENGKETGLVPEEVEKAIAAAAEEHSAGAEAVRFPVSLGEARNDLDKKGVPCTVYDVVFNDEVIDAATKSRYACPAWWC